MSSTRMLEPSGITLTDFELYLTAPEPYRTDLELYLTDLEPYLTDPDHTSEYL